MKVDHLSVGDTVSTLGNNTQRITWIGKGKVLATKGQARRGRADHRPQGRADGFHGYEEGDNIRWTNGDAALPDGVFANFGKDAIVELHLGGATLYPLPEATVAPDREFDAA